MAKKTVRDIEVKGKKVLMRVDFNVPIKNGVITDDTRIRAALPTIKYVLENGGKAILLSHLGRVEEEAHKAKASLAPVAQKLAEYLGQEVKFIPQTRGEEVEKTAAALQEGQVMMLENTRFEDVVDGKLVKLESKNNADLGKYWASLGDVLVNDAFGTAHRAHASNCGIAKNLEAVSGFLMEKEIKFVGGVVEAPEKPLVAILGGAKVSDKIGVIESLLEKADKVLIGGAMMFTFFKAQGKNIGSSRCEDDKVDLAKELLAKAAAKGVELLLPVDTVVAQTFSNDVENKVVSVDAIEDGWMGLDVGPATVKLFSDALIGVKTVVWNGPMGVFEMSNYAKGTIGVCEAIAKMEGAITIIGGGDSAAAAEQLGFADDFTHISTGGGASLEYLEGKILPGVAAIANL